ncbi:siderophore biosynthesis protein-like protein [Dothidotthia symphoricarpi CBS 119687]|uniref:Siderophore biosynthesis protein-like protein n=1 Tax=Dothidotthia symphoricarpi CBS 119687 TaxID=1392245 RepID=A0A6A6AIE8_9PLEO|nr:siderophore biosynthesis protein-like protein [Dothidotthia symphoricarpi CBS 119687]KAF2130201.1 siderophore biosynthesis protein-like protein [Dothidotthia symphoricarpi CBS 119687]
MAPNNIVHLPNGQNLTVIPVFGGLFFKANDLLNSHSPFPPGWTIVLNSEDEIDPEQEQQDESDSTTPPTPKIHRYKRPTLHGDHLYISSISNPSSSDYKAAASPTRQIAMMLWATLYWYFHQYEPTIQVTNDFSKNTADAGKPKGEWRININREGVFKGKVVLPKLERMGLIACEDSTVGCAQDAKCADGWTNMFVSRTTFWQLDPRIYLFTLSPMSQSPFSTGSPYPSRPSSPVPGSESHQENQIEQSSTGLWSPTAPGPFHSSSHLPTYYPPPPAQYIFSNHVRHPIRPKPPRQGEMFYTRYIPSVGQYLSFRVASISSKALRHRGPVSTNIPNSHRKSSSAASDSLVPTFGYQSAEHSDSEYLHKWMNDPRVSHFWGEAGPQSHQEEFLRNGLQSKNSFPVIGCWDGKPFGYFEIYWVKEDNIGKYLPNVGDYDRGFHCLIGEQEFRGAHRVKLWLSALVHYCWLADHRTERVMLEPRVDNEKLARYLQEAGFYKEREVSLPHKQSNLFKINRDVWKQPAL